MKRALAILLPFTMMLAMVTPSMSSKQAVSTLDHDIITTLDEGYIPRDISSLMGFSTLHDDGYNGTGVSIAILDTGIDGSHPDLAHALGTNASAIVINQTFVPSEPANDYDGHGTFITGMIVGNGDSSNGSIVGLSPGADIWNVKVLDSIGEGEVTWVENALDWILGLTDKPDIISLSFGASTPLPTIEDKIYELWEAGVIAVIAAGNSGPDYYTIDSPGNVLDAITVGACTTDEYLLSFSSEGPTNDDEYYKPDVVAFGVDLVSTGLSSGYVEGSGTSFSVPFISAGIALLIEATGGVHSPDEIKAAVIESATPLGYSYFMEGAGLPNFTRALELLQNSSWDGFAMLPGNIEFPVTSKEGTITLDKYSLKITMINSRYDGNLSVDVTGDIVDFTTVMLERYEGGKDQFVIAVDIMENSLAFTSGSGTINIRDGETVIVAINVIVTGEGSVLFSFIIIIVVIGFLIGIFAFFAIAYRKGTKAMPYNRCEFDGTCVD